MMKRILLTMIVSGGLVGVSSPAMADCSSKYWDCAKAAYQNPDFWSWYAAQIDCELDYIECERIALIGR